MTPEDTFPEVEFLGQEDCALRIVYIYCSVVSPNLPVQCTWEPCGVSLYTCPKCDLASRIYHHVGFMVDYIVCRMREVVVPIYPDACGVDVTGHKALDGTGHQELAIRVWLRSGQIFTHVKI